MMKKIDLHLHLTLEQLPKQENNFISSAENMLPHLEELGIGKGVLEYLATSSLLKEDSIIIVEASVETNFDYVEELGYEITKYKKYKTNVHVFLQRK